MTQSPIAKLIRHPSVLLAVGIWLIWSTYMWMSESWHLFQDYGFVSATMAFASFIAGATSEGGGAVAFPVLTIFFDIKPTIARDFSLAIQSVGMTAAAFAIFMTKIPIERRALLFATIGGIPGVFVGLFCIAPLMSPVYTKMFFVSLWLSFGIVVAHRHLFTTKAANNEIRNFSNGVKRQLILLGLIGGTVTGITGSGIDIVVFSYLVLQHRVDIRVATATSVVLMAGNAIVGISMRLLDANPVADVVWSYWLVSIPIVIVGAPLGARFISKQSFKVVASLLIGTISAQFLGALVLVPQSLESILLTITTISLGILLFSGYLQRSISLSRS